MVKLVIFDCDGVLVDTEVISNRVLAEVLQALGLAWTPAEMQSRFLGRSMASVAEIVTRDGGLTLPADFIESAREATYAAFRREGLLPIPGIEATVRALAAAGVASCVASSGEIVKMHLTLGMTGLLPLFEGRLFSATMVARGKPAPDLFLHAAERMQVAPADCLVVEDALPGLEAARAAGMRAVAYAAAPWCDRAAMARLADEVIDDMAALPPLAGLSATAAG